jgi:eukaryotic-like serine/threonine-protein kinase
VFEPGTQLGRYEIQRRLGRGGMGTVYVAHDPVLGRMVAIKVFAGDLDVPDARERFSREARAAAALNHPNIVTVYDFGEYGSQPFIVMEYVPGETMANLIRRKVPVSVADKLRWMEELCAGAGYAHQMSVIHRDIKPANLMIDRSGRLKILDFGIARMLGIASNTAVMIGTPGYMAPEQITGDPVDHRSDQFSIGVVFYELLAYTEAFPGDTLPAITHRILNEEPKSLSALVADLSPDVAAIVQQALRKNVAERFRDTDAMRGAIARARRQFETDDGWSAQTMPVGRDVTPPGGLNRGTGSARRRTGDAVGVAQLTPPPDPRRSDREALARRRAAQVEAALADARRLFAQEQLEAALDACQQALTLDESHVGALELEEQIQSALGVRGSTQVTEDPDRTVASAPLDPAALSSRLVESQAVTRIHDEEFALTGLPPVAPEPPSSDTAGVGERTVLRPVVPRVPATVPGHTDTSHHVGEATVVVPSRRTPVPEAAKPATIPPASAPPLPAAPPAAPAPAATQSIPAPSAKASIPAPSAKASVPAPSAMQPIKVPAAKPAGPDLLTRIKAIPAAVAPVAERVMLSLRAIRPPSLAGTWPATSPQQARLVWAGVVVLIAIATTYLLTRGPVPTGLLVIDAVPWATVTGLQSEDGAAQALPESASTPLSLSLPAGTYRVTLTGPPPESQLTTVSVRVDVDGVAVVPITRFHTMTAEQYFVPYLSSSTATGSTPPEAAPASAGESSAAVPAAAPAGTGGNQ